MSTNALAQRLEEEQLKLARSSLSAPADRSEFEYGRVSGIYAGLERAKQIVLNFQAEKDEKTNDL